MNKYQILTKFLGVGIILLFFGVTIVPSINFSVVKASAEDEFVQYDTEVYGLPELKHQTVKLSKQQASEVNTLLQKLEERLSKVRTKVETAGIFNQAVDEFYRYGLIGDVSVEQLKVIFARSVQMQEQLARFIDKNGKMFNKIGNGTFENIGCLVFSRIKDAGVLLLSFPMRTFPIYLLIKKIIRPIDNSLISYLRFFLICILYAQWLIRIPSPIALRSWTIIEGWNFNVYSFGLYGLKTQALYDECIDLFGSSGIKIQSNPYSGGIGFRAGFILGCTCAISKMREWDQEILP
jgi:hypothetical protein